MSSKSGRYFYGLYNGFVLQRGDSNSKNSPLIFHKLCQAEALADEMGGRVSVNKVKIVIVERGIVKAVKK